MFVVLENIETGKQTGRYRALASDGKIIFMSDDFHNYDKILSNRNPNESNRIRAIIYAHQESFKSKSFDVKVGVKIICYAKQPDKLIFNAIIDQYIIDSFHFAPRLALFKDTDFNGQKIFESNAYSSKPEVVIENAKDFGTTNLVFNVNPRGLINNKVFRTDVESLRAAIMELKAGGSGFN